MNPSTVIVLAHQGGWDELLVFAVPLVLFGGLTLWDRFKRRH